jgi:hypothetical protein
MKKMELMNKLGDAFGKASFTLKKHSPEILVVSGVIGVVTSAVLACKATLKLNEVLTRAKDKVEDIHWTTENGGDPQEAKKELTAVYARTGLELVGLYLPSVGLGALSIAGILTSNNILCKRNAALAAAYTAIEGSFQGYRARLIERFGEEVDKELRYNVHQEKLEGTEVDENGKTKKVKKTVQVTDIDETSDYARYYDHRTSQAWEESSDYNRMFLKAQQNLANNLLIAHGYLFLNDVYEMLGIQRSIPGQVVGWVYDKAQDCGENYVDFGITETYRKDESGELMPTILLDFNVDGNIWERAAQKKLVTA